MTDDLFVNNKGLLGCVFIDDDDYEGLRCAGIPSVRRSQRNGVKSLGVKTYEKLSRFFGSFGVRFEVVMFAALPSEMSAS